MAAGGGRQQVGNPGWMSTTLRLEEMVMPTDSGIGNRRRCQYGLNVQGADVDLNNMNNSKNGIGPPVLTP